MDIYQISEPGDILRGNSYAGRGIIVGKTDDEESAVFAYFIMGRSNNSRNRIFAEKENGEVIIYPYDYSKVEDPSLIIYSPVKVIKNHVIVTNGDQTDTVFNFIENGKSFEEALQTRCFEPDAPNFTPRISAIIDLDTEKPDFTYKMSILKSGDARGSVCNRYTFSYNPIAGLGHFIHTYACDGNPLPTFCGEPERVHICNDVDEFTGNIWNNLDKNNKISLYVRYINLKTGEYTNRLINKYGE